VSVVQTVTTSFKVEILNGYHAFSASYRPADTFNIALYSTVVTLDSTVTAYSPVGEASGGSYVPGGQIIAPIAPLASGTTACLSFNPVSWAGVITANSALIYNSSQGGRSVCVLNFGANKTSATNFSITFPTDDQNNAVVRIA